MERLEWNEGDKCNSNGMIVEELKCNEVNVGASLP